MFKYKVRAKNNWIFILFYHIMIVLKRRLGNNDIWLKIKLFKSYDIGITLISILGIAVHLVLLQ